MQRIRAGEEGMREWTDLLVDELYVFIGAIIYMGIQTNQRATEELLS